MSQNDPRLTPLAASLPASVPFVGPEAQERAMDRPFDARLGANENVFGPSPRAIQAMQDGAAGSWMYADPEAHDLRQALALHHDIAPEHIMIGEGIDGLLGLLVRLIIGAGDAVVTSEGAYPTFNYHVAGFGGTLHKVAYTGDYEDPERLIAKAKQVDAKLIYIANPDNPMGTYHDAETINRMIREVPEKALLILDEAYVECAPDGVAPVLRPTEDRVIRMRTFSKAYGMAGARVGYAIGPAPLISAFNKVRNHFGMSRASLAGAVAALADQDWLGDVTAKITQARSRITDIATENGLETVPSATNFVAIDCGHDGAFARAVLAALIDKGLFVRMPFVAPQDRCIRVSCGTPQDLDRLATALPGALVAARKTL